MERYPQNTKVTLDDFKKCGWQDAIKEAGREGYSSMWQALSAAAGRAIEEKRLSEGKALWLLADACSMMLKPSSLNEPFAPFMVMDGKRSALPDDFQQDDIVFLGEVVSEISDPKLCARISDIVWIMAKSRNPKFALSAIDNYLQISISTESWIRDGRECWERAIHLCLMLKAGAGERLNEIEKVLVDSLKNATYKDGYLVFWLAELCVKHGLGVNDQITIAQKLETLAANFEDAGELHRSRDYFDAAGDWYKKASNPEKSAEMTIRNAEGWVKEAIVRQSSDIPSHMVAVIFYENAIQKYRTIPRALRAAHDIDNRIVVLRNEMNNAEKNSLNEIGVISSGQIDITELIENAIKSVKGKSALDALLALANVYRGASEDEIREFFEKMIREHPLPFLFSGSHMSREGRVIAKSPGTNLDGENEEKIIWPEMVKHYMTEIGVVVQGSIWPALEVVRQEHRLKESDFYSIARQSPIVPPGREWLFAKALFSGYDNDFVTALHILTPQIEHLVRFHLKKVGVITTHLDSNGIENENGLSTLMEHAETKKIFGANLAFELKALFCDPVGPNLRNEMAHGLISYEECVSIYSIYAWWICLRVTLNTFWNTRQRTNPEVDTSNEPQVQNA